MNEACNQALSGCEGGEEENRSRAPDCVSKLNSAPISSVAS